MYGELVRRLREATIRADSGNEISESLYIDILQAADAIEKLCGLCASQSKDCSEAVAKYLELWAKQPRWIPVTERCPEKSGDYLVFDDCRNLYVNEWHCLLKRWQYDDSRISHWMPLPTPPKEET